MIQANELRIGNWVTIEDGEKEVTIIEPNKVGLGNYGIGRAAISASFYNYSEIQPIPLTEEWLLKFGFEEYCGGWENNIRLEYVPEMSCYWFDTDGGRIIQTRPIIYVHQLQNLYFALT